MEFNFCSERDKRGLEWRSFNIRGIKTWAEFEEMFKIARETITFFLEIKKLEESKRLRVAKEQIVHDMSEVRTIDEVYFDRDEQVECVLPLKNGKIDIETTKLETIEVNL
jgi:hypothetical protein